MAHGGPFCVLLPNELAKLDKEKSERRYAAGSVLFYEGGAPLALYCVIDGVVKLSKATPAGRSMVIRLQGPGELVGFRAVLANEPYAATAEVVESADVCTIPAATFQGLLQQSPEFCRALLEKLARELRISEDRMLDQTILTARTRVARILVFLAGAEARGTNIVIQSRLRRQDLAEAAGVTPQTFSRILHELTRQGVINSNRTRIIVHEFSRLRRIAESLA